MAKGFKKSILSWDFDGYAPHELSKHTQSDLEKEYKRLRETARKRLDRLRYAGYASSDIYKQYKGKFPTLKEMKKKGLKIEYELSRLARFLENKASTVKGMKESRSKALETLHNSGYTWLNEANLTDFFAFMEEYRAQKLDKLFDSGDAVDLFESLQDKGIEAAKVFDDFESFLENTKKVLNMKIPKKYSKQGEDAVYDYIRKKLKLDASTSQTSE